MYLSSKFSDRWRLQIGNSEQWNWYLYTTLLCSWGALWDDQVSLSPALRYPRYHLTDPEHWPTLALMRQRLREGVNRWPHTARDPRGTRGCHSTKNILEVLKFPEIKQEREMERLVRVIFFFPRQLYSCFRGGNHMAFGKYKKHTFSFH